VRLVDATMDAEAGWVTIEAERRSFADLLDGLTPDQWAAPSLCAGWSVREVVAHTMVGQTGTMRQFAVAMLRARGSFDRANHLLAVRRATLPASELVESLRTHAAHRFTPPGMSWRAPLTDLLIHRLDALVPLGVDPGPGLDGWPVALDYLRDPKAAGAFAAKGAPALTYVATDVAWSHGSGPRVEAPAEALALALTRRTARLAELDGPGAEALARWSRRDG
jgi:uncharacterized protein (TIGR03083 family)